jgi:HAD superfamily hydrolase (TIGR01509 family)
VTNGPAPRLVIFDMDDVLCRYDLDTRLAVLSGASGRSPKEVRAALWDSGFEDHSDAGGFPDGASYLAAFSQKLGADVGRAQWIAARRAAMTVDHALLDLVRTIGRRAKLALFTNNGPLLKDTLAEIMPVFSEVFGAELYCSCEFAAKKPDPVTYLRLLERLGFKPGEAYFIDDKPANVEGALAAGLLAHHYTSRAAFEREARDLGLLP